MPLSNILANVAIYELKQKYSNIWDKVFKNGASEICGRQPLKNLKRYGLPKQTSRPYLFTFFKGCLPQISLAPFLNTLPHIIVIYNSYM